MPDHHSKRKEVSKFYETALQSGSCCCGPTPSQSPLPTGYRADDLSLLSGGESSFGCGNPMAFADVGPGDVVLDLGAGAGLDLLIAAEKVGDEGKVIGVDMTDAMLEAARANAERAGFANVELRKGIIEALPVEDATVDHVISNCVINLSPEKERVFSEIVRVLRPGGRIRISDIMAEDLPDEVKHDPELHGACIGGAIPEDAYVDGLERAGLVDVEVLARLRYDAAQIGALASIGTSCCGGPDPRLEALAGRIWSATISGRKP